MCTFALRNESSQRWAMRSIPNVKVQSWADFKKNLLTTAKGGPAPTDAGGLFVESRTALSQINARDFGALKTKNPTLIQSKSDPVKKR